MIDVGRTANKGGWGKEENEAFPSFLWPFLTPQVPNNITALASRGKIAKRQCALSGGK